MTWPRQCIIGYQADTLENVPSPIQISRKNKAYESWHDSRQKI